MLCGGLLFYFMVNMPLRHRIEHQSVEKAGMAAQIAARQNAWLKDSPQLSLNAFYDFLPKESATEDLLEAMFDAAFDSDLFLQKANYQMHVVKDTAITEYQIDMPVQGSYKAISKFMHRVLQDIPSVTLDSVKMSRDDARANELDAQLHFSLLLRSMK